MSVFRCRCAVNQLDGLANSRSEVSVIQSFMTTFVTILWKILSNLVTGNMPTGKKPTGKCPQKMPTGKMPTGKMPTGKYAHKEKCPQGKMPTRKTAHNEKCSHVYQF